MKIRKLGIQTRNVNILGNGFIIEMDFTVQDSSTKNGLLKISGFEEFPPVGYNAV
jgi:hypothetical protein